MGNCQYCVKKNRKKVTIMMVGLDNAGKTTTAKAVQNLPLNTVAPTVGYTSDEFKFGAFQITLIDLGGGKKIRGIWKNYYAEVHGVVYVIDSSDRERIDECKEELTELVKNSQIQEKPLLVLANKQDKEGAMDEVDLSAKLDLEALVNENKCYCKVETSSSISGKKNKAFKSGLNWILSTIDHEYDALNARVVNDVRVRDAALKEEMDNRKQKIYAQRKKEEMEEKNGESDTETPNGTIPIPVFTGSSSPKIAKLRGSPQPIKKSGLGSQLLDDLDFDAQINLPGSCENVKMSGENPLELDVIKPIPRSSKTPDTSKKHKSRAESPIPDTDPNPASLPPDVSISSGDSTAEIITGAKQTKVSFSSIPSPKSLPKLDPLNSNGSRSQKE